MTMSAISVPAVTPVSTAMPVPAGGKAVTVGTEFAPDGSDVARLALESDADPREDSITTIPPGTVPIAGIAVTDGIAPNPGGSGGVAIGGS